MPNLAGYDLIIEIARMAIEREVLNTPLETGPNGEAVDTLVPPFHVSRSLPLAGPTAVVNMKVTEFTLRARVRTASFDIHIAFEEMSISQPGLSITMLAGTSDVTAPLLFTPPAVPAGAPPGAIPVSQLVLDFGQSVASLQLDAASNARIDAQAGAVAGAMIRGALPTLMTGFLNSQGQRPLGFSFRVDSARNSTDVMTLTSVPSVLWIDGETLGFFGYHRAGAGTGNPGWKTGSDLPRAPYPGFPWFPVAFVLSPWSFQQLIACPAARGAARDHVAGKLRDQYVNEERASHNNQGPATQAEIDAAEKRLNDYLNSPPGRAETDTKVPAPCGQGAIDQRIKMPDPFEDTTAYIDWLSMALGQGQIDVLAKAHASVFCGSVNVSLPMWIKPSIGPGNTIVPGPIFKGDPHPDVDADLICEIAVDVILSFIVGPFLGSVVTLIAFALAESLAEGLVAENILKQNLPAPGIGGGAGVPPQVRLRDVRGTFRIAARRDMGRHRG